VLKRVSADAAMKHTYFDALGPAVTMLPDSKWHIRCMCSAIFFQQSERLFAIVCTAGVLFLLTFCFFIINLFLFSVLLSFDE